MHAQALAVGFPNCLHTAMACAAKSSRATRAVARVDRGMLRGRGNRIGAPYLANMPGGSMRRRVTEKDRAETGPRALLRPSDDSVGVEPASTELQPGGDRHPHDAARAR